MARLRYNGLGATLGAALTSSDTTITFSAALTHSGGTAVPTITGSDYIPLTIFTSTGAVSEIVYLTAYTSGTLSGTITRAQESTTAAAHSSGDAVVHSATVADFSSSSGGVTVTTGSDTSQSAASTGLGVNAETVLVSTTTITPTVDELVTVVATATASGPGGVQGAYITPGFRFNGSDNHEPAGSVTANQTVRNPLSATPITGSGMFYLRAGVTYTLHYRLKTGSGGAVPTTTFTNVQATYRRAQSV